MTVSQALFRFYRPMLLIFGGILLAGELVGVTVAVINGRLNYSWWLTFSNAGVRIWLVIVGLVLVGIQLKQFVSNGVTRREFLAGAAKFMLILSVGYAAAEALGHGLESLLVGLADQRSSTYPVATAGQILSDFGHALPGTLAWPLSGALVAIGFYRFKPLVGVAVMVLGAVPAVASDYLLRIDGEGDVMDRGPFAVALIASLVIIAAGAVAFQRAMSDVPIRRTAG
jgi:hypothetical protein